MSDKIRFTPVRGTTEAIAAIEYTDGNLYFDTDQHTIWLDSKGQRIPMGSGESSGGSGIIIANKTLSFDEEELSAIDFVVTDLNIDYLPLVDAIILNVPDGCFYRVISVNEDSITAERLTVSGGGGGAAAEPTLSISIDSSTLDSNATLVYGQEYPVSVTGTAINGNTDNYVSLIFSFVGENDYSESFTISRVPSGKPYKLDLSFLPINNSITMTVSVDSDNANMHKLPSTKKSGIKVVDMHVDKVSGYDFIPVQAGTLQLRYVPYGRGLGVQLHVAIDGEEYDHGITLIEDNIGAGQTVGIPKQSHGTHVISLWLSAIVNRMELSCTPIYYEASWVDDEEEAPLIWTGDFPETTIQYESLVIPYMVYDITNERNGATTTVDFYKHGSQVGSEEIKYSSSGWKYWDVTTLYEVGENEFTISCGPTSKTITFNITTEGSRDLALVNQSALKMNFDSMGRSSTEIASTRSVWKSKVGNYEAILSNFNWYNNGWVDDKDGFGSYLSIANGASVEIPYDTINMGGAQQWTFEMRFRVRNAHKYATLVTEIPLYKYWIEVTERDENGRAINGIKNEVGTEQTLDWIAEHNYEVVLDEDGNKEMEESNTTKKVVETSNNVILKYLNNNNEGFCIGTQEAYFNTSGKTVNVRYKEDAIINITFVVDKNSDTLSIYLNGILSGAVNLSGIPSITMEHIPFRMNSEYCDLDLYKFRVYDIALTMPEVIHNYLADIKNIALYDENQLADVNDATKLSYTKLVEYNLEHPDNLTMPYVLIDSSGTPNEDRLPFSKGEKRKVSITFVNPTADKLLEDGVISDYEYYTHCPSFTSEKAEIDVQGTSSQKYPRRNFKVKFKNAVPEKSGSWTYTKGELAGQLVHGIPYEKDGKIKYKNFTLSDGSTLTKKWHEDNVDLATNVFTWKIDYMESSGSYNTGFANLMGNEVYNKHPLDDLGFDASLKNYRTSVYGFPFLAFHKRADGSITYIGRYNFNLDKGSNEYYGFEDEADHPYVDGKTIADVAECWELRDNQGTWCSFRYPTDSARENQFMTPTVDSTPQNPKIEVAQHFEARYHAEADAIEAAQSYSATDGDDDYSEIIGGSSNAAMCAYLNTKLSNLKVLFNWLDSTDVSHPTNKTFVELRAENHPYFANLVGDTIRMEVTATSEDETVTYEDDTSGATPKLYGIFTADTVEYRRQKFRNEFKNHLDLHYCTIYFIMTELLLCYDSRGKNMMIASFGPKQAGGDYIWYPIFYDIDTQLGLNNVGALLWDYDEDSSENGTFSTGDSVLWTNFYDMFRSEILATYSALRKTSITYTNIEGAYTCDPNVFTNSYAMRGARPIIAIGLDEYYKYVLPVTEPYTTQTGSEDTANYLYACQGDRILSRELLINNRLLYMDSKWHAGNFAIEKTMNSVTLRCSGNDPYLTSDIYVQNDYHKYGDAQTTATFPVPYYDANPVYKVTPYLNFYISWFTDENLFANSEPYDADKYPDGQNTTISESTLQGFIDGSVDEQLSYFPGVDYISSFGDLSDKYLTQVSFSAEGAKLLDFTLGSDAPGYFNNKMKVTDFDLGTGANKREKGLLQKIILSHLRSLDTFLDVSNPKKLREFRALDTPIKYVLFADGAPLTIVHLPNTVTRLKFIENKNLTRILKTAPIVADMVNGTLVYRPESEYSGLYVEGLTDYNPVYAGTGSPIGEVEFEGDALGYGSYEILSNVVALKTVPAGSQTAPGRLKIRMDSVNWTPYKVVDYGEPKQPDVTYYYLTDHSTYELYSNSTYANNSWTSDTLNGKIFTFDSTLPKSTIPDLSLLDQFIEDYENGLDTSSINQFTNNNDSMATVATVPTLTGNLFVANGEGIGIDEDKLDVGEEGNWGYKHYWPNLKITAEKINESYIAKFVQILDSGKEDEVDVKRFSHDAYDGNSPTRTTKIPSKTNYTLVGWALDPAGTQMVWKYNLYDSSWSDGEYIENNAFKFSESNNIITLYAIFTKKVHGIKYRNADGSLIRIDESKRIYPPEFNVSTASTQELTDNEVTMLAEYGEPLPPMNVVPYKDDSALPLLSAYVFKGWATSSTSEEVATNLATKTVTSNLTYWAVFEEVNDIHNFNRENPLLKEPQKYFTLDENGLLSVKSGIKLSGKVVIPNAINGVPVQGIKGSDDDYGGNGIGFYNQIEVSHIFLENPTTSQLVSLGRASMSRDTQYPEDKFIYLELPKNGNVRIVRRAFSNAVNFLKAPSANSTGVPISYVQYFFSKIVSIGQYAFMNAGLYDLYVYNTMTTIDKNAFNNNYSLARIQFGDATGAISTSTTALGESLFNNCSNIATVEIYTAEEEAIWENKLYGYNIYVTPTFYPM